jgi:polysaccharide biosynthesis/export protein
MFVARMCRQLALLLLVFVGLGNAMAVAQPADSGYVLGADDTIQVIVYNQPEAGITTRIKSDGTIVMPLIGTIKAAGQTNVGLARLITDKLTQGGFLKAPVVNIEIGAYVSKSVNVAGRVTAPGIIALDRPYRALEVLLKAGWIAQTGASYVYLRRPGAPEQRLDTEALVRGEPDKDPLLRAGDTLYIYGQINRSGSFPVLPGLTVRQALAIAGGVTATGQANKVGLIRPGAKETDADLAQLVGKNDVIIIKERLF